MSLKIDGNNQSNQPTRPPKPSFVDLFLAWLNKDIDPMWERIFVWFDKTVGLFLCFLIFFGFIGALILFIARMLGLFSK
jgi:hypothetical protein